MYFFLNKTMGKYGPGTEFTFNFCARIGPLGVVLVGPILDDRLKEKLLKP